jgi:hypothetical protein
MKRIRLSTLLLLIVVLAHCVALVVRERQVAREEAKLKARLALSWPLYVERQATPEELLRLFDKESSLDRRLRPRELERLRELNEQVVQSIEELRRLNQLLRFDKLPDP